MKRTTRVFALVLALVMIFALVSCAKDTNTKPNSTPQASSGSDPDTTNTGGPLIEDSTLEVTQLVNGYMYKTNDEGTAQKKTEAGTLVIGTNKAIEAAQPCQTDHSDAEMVIYDRLFEYDVDTGTYLPSLAVEWGYTDDTHFELKIRDDVYFHNGEHLTIDDVIFTIENLQDSTACPKWSNYFTAINIAEVEVLNDYQCIIPMNYAWGLFESYFSMNWAGIICRSYIEANPDSYWDAPNGTGPFKQSEIVSGDRHVLVANENYWGELPQGYSKIIVKYYADPTTMYIDYEAGNLDVVYFASAEDVQRALDGGIDHTTVQIVNADVVYCLGLWTGHEAFSDPLVREAVSYAIDFSIVSDIGMGVLGVPADSVLTKSCSYAVSYDLPDYNVEKAKELLKQAGYGDGFEFVFGCNSNAIFTAMAEVLQGMLSEVGITMKVETYDASALVGKLLGANNNGVPEVDAWFWTKSQTTRDPSEALAQFEFGNAFAIGAVTDEKIGELFEEGKRAVEYEERYAIYEEIQDYLCGTYVLDPIGEYCFAIIYRDYVEDWTVAFPKGDLISKINIVE